MNTAKTDQPILLEVKNLKTWFPVRRGLLQRTVGNVKAVDDVSFFCPPRRDARTRR